MVLSERRSVPILEHLDLSTNHAMQMQTHRTRQRNEGCIHNHEWWIHSTDSLGTAPHLYTQWTWLACSLYSLPYTRIFAHFFVLVPSITILIHPPPHLPPKIHEQLGVTLFASQFNQPDQFLQFINFSFLGRLPFCF